jgi:homoserine O-acetyltransferase
MTNSALARAPATGVWREGEHPGRRRFADLGPVDLALGGRLDRVRVAYETWGRPAADGRNAVLVLHALTGDSHVVGPAGPGHQTAGWWDGLIGPGAALDPEEWFVVAPNVLGGCQGTSGPGSLDRTGRPLGSRFPRITVADQVAVELALADHLGIGSWAAVVGGSMGGMRALEWCAAAPDRVGAALVLAVGAAASADQIATQVTQVRAITGDPDWRGGDYYDTGARPGAGMGLARRIAHLTYRTGEELQSRFGNARQGERDPAHGGRYAVESYLDHHAGKLDERFDPGSYVALTDAMTTWDLGRGRGPTEDVLRSLRVPMVVAGIDTDRLYPLWQQEQLAELVPGSVDGRRVVRSAVGHDGFLVEHDRVFPLVAETALLGRSSRR